MSSSRQQPSLPSGQPSASSSTVQSPQFLQPILPDSSSSLLRRTASHSSQPLVRVPSPRAPVRTSSKGSFTPKLLSRRNSTKDQEKASGSIRRHGSIKSNDKSTLDLSQGGDEGWRSPMSESGSAEVVETQAVRVQRDQESGKWMINQYRVLREIGHGTHGRVRLGEDLSADIPIGDDEGDVGLGISAGSPFYAIKIVDRNPKKKRLTGLSRQKGKAGRDGAKMLNEAEIRKEIAIFKKVNHPNVVRMKEIIDDPESSKLYMVLEWCENGEIRWKEDEGGPALTIGETRRIFRDTLLGLEYLHHQGIIHRDIKPSNLLRAADGTVKISDFGCSHFSEALRAASAQPGPDGDAYVDDIELAKTAGSPAFFAPEMCYSGLDTDITPRSSSSPHRTPVQEIPGFTLRPPSVVDRHTETRSSQSDPTVGPASATIPLRPTISNDSAFSRRPASARSHSSATIQRRERLAITNAIDVWALGVTLYCLLFGKTPFDAPNEYLLMQVIPVQDYIVPPVMGKERMATGTGGAAALDEAKECLDLLSRLLEKDPNKRIKLEQAKKHPFTLRGLSDPASWLAKTDPHTQTFVTVSNDEVAAVVTKSTGFRDRFRKGIKSISHKLHILSGASRSRSQSIGDTDSPIGSADPSVASSALGSQISLHGTPRGARLMTRIPSANRDVSPMTSPLPPPPGITRRFSLLGAKLADSHPSPQPVASASSSISSRTSPESGGDPATRTPAAPSASRGFTVQRQTSAYPTHPSARPSMVPMIDDPPRSPRPVASSSSLDKFKSAAELSPNSSLHRVASSEVDVNRQRSHSNASSISSKLARLLRTGSQRSRTRGFQDKEQLAGFQSDSEDVPGPPSAGSMSPADALGRMSIDEGLPRSSRPSMDTTESGSSHPGFGPSPDRPGGLGWESRLRGGPLRRGSNLSEEFTRNVDEEIDWAGSISDEDDYDDTMPSTLPPSAPNLTPGWRRARGDGLALDIQPSPIAQPVSAAPKLDPIPDGSPSASSNLPIPQPNRASPFGETVPRSSSRASSRLSSSPFRTNVPGDRARSPLGVLDDPHTSPMRLNSGRRPSVSILLDDDEDEGLAISVGSRRGRKGSMLGKKPAEE
nr:uncharacterized protein CI109_001784 [Kwoniella shandongensis]KAA5529844.1 hypothetical protein CI109_001784 [Kwoniella shandongensis]